MTNFARDNLRKTEYKNVTVLLEDGSMGYSYFAPYDRITVTCAAPYIPGPLLEQLKPGGIMVIPIGSDCYSQELYKIKRTAKAIYIKRKGGVASYL